MAAGGRETEAKFYVHHLDQVKLRLEELGASLIQERVLEANIRFDLPDASLRAGGRVLRLRRDTEARLTYKSASSKEQGVQSRDEVEFVVEDFDKAKQLLEALGYQKLLYYEKYRTTYTLRPSGGFGPVRVAKDSEPSQAFIDVMLDELPYGRFVEIEGEDVKSIRTIAELLRLRWETAILASYHALFERAKQSLRLSFEDLSFANFKEINIDASHLSVEAADV
jgi:adenylate cyclase class 2